MKHKRKWRAPPAVYSGIASMAAALCLLFINGVSFANLIQHALGVLALLFSALWLGALGANTRLIEKHEYELEEMEKKHSRELEAAKQRHRKAFDRINSLLDELKAPVAAWVLQMARRGKNSFDECSSLVATERRQAPGVAGKTEGIGYPGAFLRM